MFLDIFQDEVKASALVEKANDNIEKFLDRQLIAEYLTNQNKNVDSQSLDNFLNYSEEILHKQEYYNAFIIRFCIAEIINSVFSKEQKAKYLIAVLTDKAS